MEASKREAERRRLRRLFTSYAIALTGPLAVTLLTIPVRDASEPATIALLLVVVVLLAAFNGGRGPAWTASLASFVTFDLFHTAPFGQLRIDRVEELEIAIALVAIGLLIGELAVAGLNTREKILRTEFREARVGRVLAASALGIDRDALAELITHELVDELDLERAGFEPDAHSTCHYRIDYEGRLFHHAAHLEGRRQRLPSQPISVPVRAGTHDFGQLVLVPRTAGPVDDQQLLLAARLASLLAGLIHEVPPAER